MAGAASQAGDADSSRAPVLTSGLGIRECLLWCTIVGATVTASVLLFFTLDKIIRFIW